VRKFLLIASPFFCCLFFRCLFFRAAPSIVIAASDTSSSIQLSEVKELYQDLATARSERAGAEQEKDLLSREKETLGR